MAPEGQRRPRPEFMPFLIQDLKPDNPRQFLESILALRGLLRRMYELIPEENRPAFWDNLSLRQEEYLTDALPPPKDRLHITASGILALFQINQRELTEEQKQAYSQKFNQEVIEQLKEDFGKDLNF